MADKQLVVNLALKNTSFEKQIKSANESIKAIKSETKLAETTVGGFGNSLEGLGKKLQQLTKLQNEYTKKLEAQKSSYQKTEQNLQSLTNKYEQQGDKVEELKRKLKEAEEVYGKNSDEVKELKEELKQAENAYDKTGNSIVNCNNRLNKMQTQINNTEAEIAQLDNEIRDTQNSIDNFGENSGLDKLEDDLEEVTKDAVEFGAHMSEIGQGVREVGESIADTGKEMLSTVGELVQAGSEYSAEVAGTEFLLKNLDSTTQNLINSSSELASNIGLTNKQYRDSATTIATYYKNMGMTTKQTNELTNETMSLVADLGAITDMPFDDAMDRFKSGLMGNYEALDAFGINISANTLSNSEFVKSLGKSWNSLDDNTKMLAVYKEIIRQSASATGLATQEAQEFGMQNKLLSQRTEELKGSIGEKLLPTLQPFLEKINEVVEAMSGWVEENPELTTAILTIATVIGAVLAVVGTLTVGLGTMIIMWGAISTAIASASIPFLAIGGVIAGVIAVVALLAGGIASNFEGISSACENLKNRFSESFQNVSSTFEGVFEICKNTYDTVIQPLFDTIGVLIEGVVNFIADCMPGISTAFATVFDIIATIWDSIGQPIASFMVDVFSGVVNWFVENMPFLSSVFNTVIGVISGIWNGVGKPLFDFLKTHISNIINVLKPIITSLGSAFKGAFNVIKGAWNFLSPVFDVIVKVISKLASIASSAMKTFSSAITKAMKAVLSPIQWVIDKISGLFDLIGDVGSGIGGFLAKINPFKSIDFSLSGENLVSPILDGNFALSGSYYNANTRNSREASDFVKVANNIPTVSSSNSSPNNTFGSVISALRSELNELKTNNKVMMSSLIDTMKYMTSAMENYVLPDHINFELDGDISVVLNADGKKLAKTVAPYMPKVQYKYNKIR